MNSEAPIFLNDVLPVNVEFCRSTRIDADTMNSNEFVYSDTIDSFLNTLAGHQEGDNKQGAYTWTGPYGSGKSTLALSLLSILEGPLAKRKKAAAKYNSETADRIWSAFGAHKKSWEALTIIGDRVSFFETLQTTAYEHGIISKKKIASPKALVSAISKYAANLDEHAGLLLFVDEMGKLLEFSISNQEDVYIYQLLAEAASRSEGKLVFVGILHQTFQEYASNAIKKVKSEWAKVQGRFVDISLNLTGSEQIELLSKAINSKLAPAAFCEVNREVVSYLTDLNRSPSDTFVNMLNACWPLNPIVALCLGPISRRSYGQNQRSLFSFLSSGEPLGLASYLSLTIYKEATTPTYKLSNLWDYLKLNWGNLISSSQDAHSFAIVSDLLGQLESLRAKDDKISVEFDEVVKIVQLLQMTRQHTGLLPNVKSVSLALEINEEAAAQLLQILVSKSILSYRSYNGTYVLHEGSDFDLEQALEQQLDNADEIDLAALSQQFLPSAVIGKRHYLRTGALRWATLSLCNSDSFETEVNKFRPDNSNFCKLLLSLDDFGDGIAQDEYSDHVAQVFAGRVSVSDVAYDTLREFNALKKIRETRSELARDRIARREVNERLDARRIELEAIFSESLVTTKWVNVKTGKSAPKSQLSKIVSDCADVTFSSCIEISNELINRNKVSGTANRALRQLMYDFLENEGKENLGYTKFPAERAIFDTVFVQHGLYAKRYKSWKFISPAASKSEFGKKLDKLFSVTLEFLQSERDRIVPFTEIYEQIWSKPPYGVKAGLYPLFMYIFIRSYSSNVAYYRDEVFSTQLKEVDIDNFMKTPKYCGLRFLDMDRRTKDILTDLAAIPARFEDADIESIEALDVARKLIAIYDAIPNWAKRSSKVSDNAKKIRGVFSRASDPAQFTLVDLPNLFGSININDAEERKELCEKIYQGLDELRTLQTKFLESLHAHLMNELGVFPVNKATVEKLHQRAETVQKLAGDAAMDSFIINLKGLSETPENIDKVATLLVLKSSTAWIDNDVDRIMVEATTKAREFISLETMSHIKGRQNYRKAMSIVSFDNQLDQGKVTEFAVSEEAFSEGEILAKDLLQSKFGARLQNKEQLIAMFMKLVEEGKTDG
jgi:hypothetical protein